MHGINQISSIQIFAMVIILHNPTSGDKSRFNRLPKRLETTKKSTRSRPRYLDANWSFFSYDLTSEDKNRDSFD